MDSAGQQLTLAWLASTYEMFDGASVARRDVYGEYCDFCQRYSLNATTAAIFGKLVRMVFPAISSRRLGRRGANVVHYYNFRKKLAPGPVPTTPHTTSTSTSSSSTSSSSLTSAIVIKDDDEHDTSAAAALLHASAQGHAAPPPLVSSLPRGSIAALLSPMTSDVPQPSMPIQIPASLPFSVDASSYSFPTFTTDLAMDDPYTLASSAQARVNAPPVDPSRIYVKPSPLWPASASGQSGHHHVMALAAHFMHHYRRAYFIQCPMHPAALEENNIRYILCTREGTEERSALSLNVYFALSLGAMISGHIAHARDLFQTAKEHLSDVFDMTDYSVAQALVPMGFSERFYAHDEAEGWPVTIYYLTLANQICRRLGALASDIYSRCSKAVYFMEDVDTESQPNRDESAPPATKQDTSWEEVIQTELNFHERIQQQKQSWLNYSGARRTHKILYAVLFAIVHLMDAMNNLEKLRQTAQAKRQQQASSHRIEEPVIDDDEVVEYTKRRGAGRTLARLLGLLVPKPAASSSETENGASGSKCNGDYGAAAADDDEEEDAPFSLKSVKENGLGRKDVARIAQYFTDQLLLLDEELLVLYQGTEIGERYLSSESYNMSRMFIYGLRVDNKWIAGDREAALALIMEFLELHRREKANLMLFENKPTFQRILDILLEMGRFDALRQLLAQLAPLVQVSPIFAAMCDHFRKAMA